MNYQDDNTETYRVPTVDTMNKEPKMKERIAQKLIGKPTKPGLYYVRIPGCSTDFVVRIYMYNEIFMRSKIIEHATGNFEIFNSLHSMNVNEISEGYEWYGPLEDIPNR